MGEAAPFSRSTSHAATRSFSPSFSTPSRGYGAGYFLSLCAVAAGESAIHASSAAATDPSALVAAARRPGEPWFVLEQPDREGLAIAALGAVRRLEASGVGRFGEVARRWRAIVAAAYADPPDGPPGAGLAAVGEVMHRYGLPPAPPSAG